MSLSKSDLLKIAWRTNFVRLFYNYKCLFGQGICYCIRPALLKGHQSEPMACQTEIINKHSTFFNCNEYLAGLAAGILLKQEEDDPSRTAKIRQVITSTLGAVGDRFFYQLIIPLLLLISANLLYWFYFQPRTLLIWLLVLLIIGFNLLTGTFRTAGVFIGYRQGVNALKLFKHPVFLRTERILSAFLAFMQGVTAANLVIWLWRNC